MLEQEKGDRRTRRTRHALEQALVELVEERSYESITIQQITDRANIGRATFYLHYSDKEQLLMDTMQELIDDFVRQLPVLSGQDLLAGDRRLLTADFQHVARYQRLYRALLGEHGPAFVTRRMRSFLADQIEQRVVAPLLCEVRDGATPLVPVTFLAAYLSGAMVAAVMWWLDRGCQESPEEMALLVQQANRPVLLQMLGLDGGCIA
jgi:AcrR family transcriptional regulator